MCQKIALQLAPFRGVILSSHQPQTPVPVLKSWTPTFRFQCHHLFHVTLKPIIKSKIKPIIKSVAQPATRYRARNQYDSTYTSEIFGTQKSQEHVLIA